MQSGSYVYMLSGSNSKKKIESYEAEASIIESFENLTLVIGVSCALNVFRI